MTVTELRERLEYVCITHPNAPCYFADDMGRSAITNVRKVTQTVSVVLPAKESSIDKLTEDLENNSFFVMLTGREPYNLDYDENDDRECENDDDYIEED